MNKKSEENKQSSLAQRILIIDDSEMNRAILSDMLDSEYEILEAEDGVQAIDILQKNADIDLVLLDIMMPKMDGFEVLSIMNQYQWIDEIPVIMISAESASSYVHRAYDLGVTDYISRPFDEVIVRRRVVNTLLLYNKQRKLVQLVTDQIYEKEKTNNLMINILSHIVEFRNSESGLHVLHINALTKMLLNRLIQKTDHYDLTAVDISLISTASALHDIGKITISDTILNKPGKLTKEEFEQMKKHTIVGAMMLKKLPFYADEPIVKISYEICRWHHERYDGNGYPDGLCGEEIPISAQIVAVADVYDALTSKRVYKDAVPHEEALQMISNGECGVFNPLLLECLRDVADHLPSRLFDNPLELNQNMEIRNISAELFRHKELSASERTLHLMELEQTKYQFFALMSREIQFEYVEITKTLIISDWGAKQLGLKEVAMNPYTNEQLWLIVGEDNLNTIDKGLRETTSSSPEYQQTFQIMINEKKRWYRFICRATWSQSQDSKSQYLGAIGKVIDIHDEHKNYLRLQHLVNHDSLTKLYNHAHAKKKIQEQLKKEKGNFALVLLDLDNFKNANDSRGHLFGDEVLKYTAGQLKKYTSRKDIIARVGGDEFLLFFEYDSQIEEIIDRIFHNICGCFHDFKLLLSMGIAIAEASGQEYEVLFRQADQALYHAKARGRGIYCFYDSIMEETFSTISEINV